MRPIRQLVSVLLGALLLWAALLGAIAPASAHDAAESSSPAAGATLPTPPEKVSVTFSKNPLALGSQFAVNDSAGNNWAEGGVEIVDNVASQRLRSGAPAGVFTVVWRVVSSDSHPIEG
ncbi:copper resistance CopC family protein, partial [Arthrobacter sp. SO5]|uniref:copper resistance CopC family protein n=1 Tax=Arthrobacter sp. SO5 TaxID=1897055 RepID=UPI001E340579